MVQLAAYEGGTKDDRAAMAQLLQLAAARFGNLNAWALVAFIRCAAAFKGLLQPQQLADWQDAVQSGGAVPEMTEQGISNVLLALGALADADEQLAQQIDKKLAYPFNIYYDGQLLDGLLDSVVAQQPPVRNVAHIVGALGTLRHVPQPATWQRLVSVVENQEVHAVQAGAFMVGCAWLGRNPGPKAIHACLESVERDGGSQGAANVAWALAVLQACDLGTWSRLVAHVEGAVADVPAVQLYQWAAAYQLLRLQHATHIPCQPDLLRRSLAAQAADLEKMQQRGSATRFKWVLAAAVQQLAAGQEVQPAYIAADLNGQPLVLVDVALPQLRIAVEADGPTHFLRGHNSRVAGQLQLEGPKQLTAGLVQFLREHTGLLAAMRERGAAAGGA
ncbi:hypothetical protein ABPG75_008656 [Micractinium tetrahymenae]